MGHILFCFPSPQYNSGILAPSNSSKIRLDDAEALFKDIRWRRLRRIVAHFEISHILKLDARAQKSGDVTVACFKPIELGQPVPDVTGEAM